MQRIGVFTSALALALGCGGGGDEAASSNEGTQAAAQASGPQGNASVTGTISFTGTPPANPTIDMSAEQACAAKHAAGARDPQVVVNDGKVANVLVYVKSGLPANATYSAPSQPVELDQEGCLYEPRVLGVMAEQPIAIKNSDPVLHNIKAVPKVNRGFNISQPTAGMVSRRSFNRPEQVIPIECNVHSWMHANVAVLPHPFFAVTGENGTFEIKGLPPGTYEIEAWHEKLGTRTMSVTVGDGESKKADFTFAATGA
jgi:hypothetical protein